MKFDLLVAGVGGQGILSISFVVDNAAMEEGLHFKQSEVHGMAQRGGAVMSNLRMSDGPVFSDLIPLAGADLVLSMEPLEALRYIQYLSPEGSLISSVSPVVNIPDYPEAGSLVARLQDAAPLHTLINAAGLAREAGSGYAENMVMLGAASHLLPIENKTLEKFIGVLFKAKGQRIIDVNIAAFRAGAQAGALYRDLLGAGLKPAEAIAVAARLRAWEYSPNDIEGWLELVRRDEKGNMQSWLAGRKGLLPGDAATREKLRVLDFAGAGDSVFEAAVAV